MAPRQELVMATRKPTSTAVVSAIRIPMVTNPFRGPLKMSEANEADAMTVKIATTSPALTMTAAFESASLLNHLSTGRAYFSETPFDCPLGTDLSFNCNNCAESGSLPRLIGLKTKISHPIVTIHFLISFVFDLESRIHCATQPNAGS